jgi:hypothetical protein
MELQTRRWVGGLIRVGLVVLALAVLGVWIGRRVSAPKHQVRVERQAPAAAALAPGDLRIYSRDSALDVVLIGDRILSGLSPKTIDKVRTKMDAERTRDSNGLGGMIANQVRSAVASNIGVHVMYPLNEVRDLRYEDGHLYIQRMDGTETEILGNVKVNADGDRHEGVTVSEEDAKRFIDAVHARKAELHLP